MLIGVPKEIKSHENRVALLPSGALSLTRKGHNVMVEAGAGNGSGFPDEAYEKNGAQIVADIDKIWAKADMIMKVKEPVGPEHKRMREGQQGYESLAMMQPLMQSGVANMDAMQKLFWQAFTQSGSKDDNKK